MFPHVPPLPHRALTTAFARPAFGAYCPDSDLDVCPFCVTAHGLCGREDCRRQVLPQLARNRGWLKLMGEARTEQTKRQTTDRWTPAERAALAKIARRNARRVARSSRRGYYGLAKAIAQR